jgi:hypothetical protein
LFRIIDFALGEKPENPFARSEIPVFLLDAAPMLLAMILFGVCHPGRVLYGASKEAEVLRVVPAPPTQTQYAHFVEVPPPAYQEPPRLEVPVTSLNDVEAGKAKPDPYDNVSVASSSQPTVADGQSFTNEKSLPDKKGGL